jgi:hypothetical protein
MHATVVPSHFLLSGPPAWPTHLRMKLLGVPSARRSGNLLGFRARGSLSLQPWIANDQGLALPPDIVLPAAAALSPYDMQIAALGQQVGAVIPRHTATLPFE